MDGIARWDGDEWYRLGTFNGDVRALASVRGQLFAGGTFTMVDGAAVEYVARFRAGLWEGLGGGVDGAVLSLTGLHGCLYVGGRFRMVEGRADVGGVAVEGVARWCFEPANKADAEWQAVEVRGVRAAACSVIVEA